MQDLDEMRQDTIEQFARGLEARIAQLRRIAQRNSKLSKSELLKQLGNYEAIQREVKGEKKKEAELKDTVNLFLYYAKGKAKGRTWVDYDEQLEAWKDRAPPGFPAKGKALKEALNGFATIFVDVIPIVYCSQGAISFPTLTLSLFFFENRLRI